jgi:hypothetical protein
MSCFARCLCDEQMLPNNFIKSRVKRQDKTFVAGFIRVSDQVLPASA